MIVFTFGPPIQPDLVYQNDYRKCFHRLRLHFEHLAFFQFHYS